MKRYMADKNNKGFSLVELIIVIAIMALLVAIIAPSLLQYINKSKKAVDINNSESVGEVFMYAAMDPTEPDTIAVGKYLSISAKFAKSENRLSKNHYYRVLAFQNAGYQTVQFQLMNFNTSNSGLTSNDLAAVTRQMQNVCEGLRPLKFTKNITLDQWVICCDEKERIYVFITGGVNNNRWYLYSDNNGYDYKVMGNDSFKAYMVWPETCQGYLDLRTPNDADHQSYLTFKSQKT